MVENRELALVLKLVADEFQKELRNSQGALGQFNTFIKDWRTQMAAAGTALFAIAKSTANYGDELFKTSQKVGIQVEALAGLQHAAKLADVDNRQLQTGLQALSRAMVDSAQGVGEGKEAFDRVGISATDSTGKLKPMQDVLLELADVFSQTQDGAGKTEVAMKLLGKSGVDLIPLLNSGKASIQELMEEARRLGLVMSEEDARAAEEFNDSITRLEAQAKGFSITIGRHMIGPLTELMSLMNDLGGGPIAEALGAFLTAINKQLVMFGTFVREVGANIDWLRGKINFDELAAKIKQIEAEATKKLFLIEHPQAKGLLDPQPNRGGRSVELGVIKPSGKAAGNDAKEQERLAKEQERLGKAKLDIFLAQNRALEIQWKLQQGLMQDAHVLEMERAENAEIQEGLGRRIVLGTQLTLTQQEQERLGRQIIQQTQAQIAIDQQRGQEQERLGHQIIQQTQAQLAIDAQRARESMTFFDHWQEGLKRYFQDTQSAFGFAADLARRTAQFMEQNFRTFFFDVFEGKINSLKDVMASFGNFVKQIMSQVLAQLATMMVLKGITGGFSGFGLGSFFGGGGGSGIGTVDAGGLMGLKFARGGMVLGTGNRDTVPALLTPGEGVLNRRAMATLDQLNNGGGLGNGPVNIQVNVVNSGRTEQPQVNYRKTMKGIVMDIIYSDPDFRQMLAGRA